ncbi:hypothetical protein [Nonomuraea sp. NPDC046570]
MGIIGRLSDALLSAVLPKRKAQAFNCIQCAGAHWAPIRDDGGIGRCGTC